MLMRAVNKGVKWTPEADAELIERGARGEYIPDMARAMGRTQEAIRTRANFLKVPVKSSAGRGR